MRKWQDAGWNIPNIFDYALALHASYINNKSAPLPEETRPEVERLLRKLGYRLVIESIEHDSGIAPGWRDPVACRFQRQIGHGSGGPCPARQRR